jgi:hypothetical protein
LEAEEGAHPLLTPGASASAGWAMANDSLSRISHSLGAFTRTIVVDGRVWFVRELTDAPYDRRGAGSLIFVTDEVMRRVRDYPMDWRALSDQDLYALSLHG